METTVGVRELKTHLSYYLRQVAAGATVIITERGKPVGQIVPVPPSLEEKLQQLVASGVVAWNGRRFQPAKPVIRIEGGPLVSDLLLEDRE
jgi:prevent-host-death family protein